MVNIKALEHLWIFEDCKDVKIDDWAILTSNMNLGFYYDENNEALEGAYKEIVRRNKSKETKIAVDKARTEQYSPVKKAGTVYCGIIKDKDLAYGYDGINEVLYVGKSDGIIKCKDLALSNYLDEEEEYKYLTVIGAGSLPAEIKDGKYIKYTQIGNTESLRIRSLANEWEEGEDYSSIVERVKDSSGNIVQEVRSVKVVEI